MLQTLNVFPIFSRDTYLGRDATMRTIDPHLAAVAGSDSGIRGVTFSVERKRQ